MEPSEPGGGATIGRNRVSDLHCKVMLPALRLGRAASVSAAPAPRKAARPIVPERWIPWIFAAKTTVSALLALLIAFRFNLDQPKWSALTVFIIAQPASGLVLAKGFYRLFGNLAGAAVALLLVSLFAQERVLFIGTLAAWIGVCTAASLYARGFASYGFVISGYIAAIVGIPGALNPGNAFYIAVARVTEVSLGIIITAAISHLVFPVSLARKLRQTVSDMRLGFADYGEALLSGGDVGALRARLLGQVVASENLLGSAIFEEPELRDRQDVFERLNLASVYLIAESQLLERRLGPCAQTAQSGCANDIHSALDEAVAAIKQWRDAAHGAADLVTRLLRAEAMLPLAQPLARDPSASDIEVVERIAVVVRLREFLAALAAYVAADEAVVSAPARPERRVRFAVSNDPVEAFWGGLRAALAFVLACLLWILADWPSGSTAAILAAVAAGRLATMEHARQATIAGTIIVALATLPAFIIIEVLLPSAEGFATFALAMGPALFLCAFLMAHEFPLAYLAGFLGALYFVSVNPLQDRMTYDAVGFINTSIAIIAAIAVSGVLYAVVVPDTPEAARHRFARRARRALVQIASPHVGEGVAAFETAMADALVQLRRHLRPERSDDMSAWDAGLALIGVGRELIALQSKERARPALRGVEIEIAAFARRPDAMRLARTRSAVQAQANQALADLRSEALGFVAARAAARRLAALSVINDDLARGGALLVREAGS